jgi:hypothetical protein
MIRLATFWAFVLAIGALGQAQQSFLLIPDWTNDRVCAFSPVDGSLINADFIPTNTTLFASPKHALPSPSGTIFVSDQIQDAITSSTASATISAPSRTSPTTASTTFAGWRFARANSM